MVAEIYFFWYFEVIFHWRSSSFEWIIFKILFGNLSLSLKFEYDPMLRYSTFDILMPSSIGGHLHFKNMSFKLKVKSQVWSNSWLLRYLTLNNYFEVIFHWQLSSFEWIICKLLFVHLSLSLKFESIQISCCWDIPHSIFWGHLPLVVIFI